MQVGGREVGGWNGQKGLGRVEPISTFNLPIPVFRWRRFPAVASWLPEGPRLGFVASVGGPLIPHAHVAVAVVVAAHAAVAGGPVFVGNDKKRRP